MHLYFHMATYLAHDIYGTYLGGHVGEVALAAVGSSNTHFRNYYGGGVCVIGVLALRNFDIFSL